MRIKMQLAGRVQEHGGLQIPKQVLTYTWPYTPIYACVCKLWKEDPQSFVCWVLSTICVSSALEFCFSCCGA